MIFSGALKLLREMPEEAVFNGYEKKTLAESLDVTLAISELPTDMVKMMSLFGQGSGHQFSLLKVAKEMVDYGKTLDGEDEEEIRVLVAGLGEELYRAGDNSSLLAGLVGTAMSAVTLDEVDDRELSVYEGMTRGEAFRMLEERKKEAAEAYQKIDDYLGWEEFAVRPEHERLRGRYLERQLLLGEKEAMQWLLRYYESGQR